MGFHRAAPLVVLAISAGAWAAEPTAPGYVSIARQPNGQPVLVVDYPWSLHRRASIEVSTLPADESRWGEVRPLWFVNRYMRGLVEKAVYVCLDRSEEVPADATATEGDVTFDVHGDRNWLGRPSVGVGCRTPLPVVGDMVGRAAFPLLEPWAPDRRRLFLELPATQFAVAGKIRVWLLRGEVAIWTETVDWPGLPQASPPAGHPPEASPKSP